MARQSVLRHECSVSTLADRYAMSFAAVQKHVAVLERAQIVTKQRNGREQLVRANIKTVREAAKVLDHFEALWRDRVDRIGDLLAQPNSKGQRHDRRKH